jgi:DNA-binding response OmpR family regulator
MKILICDDDPMTLRTLEFQFKKDGFEVIKTVNGREAAKILDEDDNIDVLIVDLYMPVMTGLELVTYVRTSLQRDMPVIVVSRVNVDDNINQALELGANAYVTKPFDLEDISNKVKNILNANAND